MEPRLWDELETLFERALALPSEQRAAFLDEVATDADHRAELASLLAYHDQATGFFADLADILTTPAREALLEHLPPPLAPDPDPHNLVGTRVAHYEVVEKLGGGGMGVVYKARDTRLGRIVALKFLPPHLSAEAQAKERFAAEAKAASTLDHPNICTLYDIGETHRGELYIAMAYYRGRTLKQVIREGPPACDEALDYATQIARGLASAHAAGIVHRDVKPANVIVTGPAPAAGSGVIKILDFGLAKMADVSLTRTGTTLGTVAYMSPEQARGEALDARTDVWSLGVVLYEMLTGHRPFRGGNDVAVVHSVLHDEPAPLRQQNDALPPALEAIVARCLDKDKTRRYPDMAALLADLEAMQRGLPNETPALPSHLKGKQWTWTAPYPYLLIGAGVVAVLALLLTQSSIRGWFAQLGEPRPPEQIEETADPPRPGASGFYTRGRAYLDRFKEEKDSTQLDFAIHLFESALQENPAYALAHAGLGEAYWHQYEYTDDEQWIEKAKLSCSRAIELDDQSAPIFVTRGLIDYGTGDYGSAKIFFQQALDRDPDHGPAYRGLAKTYAELDEDQKAEDSFKRVIDLQRDAWNGYYDLGSFYFHSSRFDEAAEQFGQVVKLVPDNVSGYRTLGGAYYALGRLEEAVAAWEQAQDIEPTAAIYANLATYYFLETQDYAEAARLYEQALALDPEDYQIWSYLAAAHHGAGAAGKARDAWQNHIERAEKRLDVNQRDAEVLARLAFAHAQLDQHEQARALLQRVLAETPEKRSLLRLIGATYELLADRENALLWLGKALDQGATPEDLDKSLWLDDLRTDPRYQELRRRYEAHRPEPATGNEP